MKRHATLAVVLSAIGALLLASCGANHQIRDEELTKDPLFGYADLAGKTLVIAGVSSRHRDFSAEERVRTGSTLSNMLIEYLGGAPNIHIVSTSDLAARLGLYEYHAMMEGPDGEGMLFPEEMHAIAAAVPEAAYILLADVRNENVVNFQDEERVSHPEGERNETKYEKQYFLTVDFQLYRISNERMVMNNTIFNRLTRKETRTTRTGCVEGCFDTVLNSILFGDPAEISREEVMEEIVERFVANLKRVKARLS